MQENSARQMLGGVLSPPTQVQGMISLDKQLFKKKLSVTTLTVNENTVGKLIKQLKKHILALRNFKSIRPREDGRRDILLDPLQYPRISEARDAFSQAEFVDQLKEAEYGQREVEIGYENWSAEEVLKAVLPEDIPNVTGFSVVGHVAHLNLRDVHSPYKTVIGQVLLDKHKNLQSVVNKTDSIDNTYRNFVMELLAGKDDMNVAAKENGCTFRFNFAKVYWNSRLGTEHERVVSEMSKESIIFDVFAGVGPFSVPAAKKGALVYCNDLNPQSYAALCDNLKRNKVQGTFHTYNLDGREFITTVVKARLLEIIQEKNTQPINVLMNLPAMAIEFLDAFVGLLGDDVLDLPNTPGVKIYCYCFTKEADYGADVARRINQFLSNGDTRVSADQCRKVRNVAPSKDMICAQFHMRWTTLRDTLTDCQSSKKARLDD